MTASVRRRVPYVTAYDGEEVAYRLALMPDSEATNGRRLSYTNPAEQDWMFGVLWHRHGMTRMGSPEWKLVNTVRQRRCMLHTLCQVCGQSAADEDGLIWWVLAELPGRTPAGEPFTNAPPTCQGCIEEARAVCPRLRKSSHVYTARSLEPYGVVAEVYQPAGNDMLVVAQTTELPLDSFRKIEYALAKQLLVVLDSLTPSQGS